MLGVFLGHLLELCLVCSCTSSFHIRSQRLVHERNDLHPVTVGGQNLQAQRGGGSDALGSIVRWLVAGI